MKTFVRMAMGLALIAGGAAVVVVAGRHGLLPGIDSHVEREHACPHVLPVGACPFCDRGLVEAGGQCSEHGVPKALCVTCDPSLITGFISRRTGYTVRKKPGRISRTLPGVCSKHPWMAGSLYGITRITP